MEELRGKRDEGFQRKRKLKLKTKTMSQGQVTDMLMLMAFMVHEDRKK